MITDSILIGICDKTLESLCFLGVNTSVQHKKQKFLKTYQFKWTPQTRRAFFIQCVQDKESEK